MKPLDKVNFDASSLIVNYPPRWSGRNKLLVFEIASSSRFPFEGQVAYSRWAEEALPLLLQSRPLFAVRSGVFEYAVPSESRTVDWHLNFADPNLFIAYDSSLLAQDELQVAEHPVLGSLRDALVSTGKYPRTIDGRGRPTPITITGVQRRCAIDTRPNPSTGCLRGLYGNEFARALVGAVAAATKPLSPPTLSNILAIAAPSSGDGEYSRDEITYVLSAAYTAFTVARRESERLVPTYSRTTIHTGFWGCGAFGGNRTLMTIIQSLAADAADVDIVFWAIDKPGVKTAEDARRQYEIFRNSISSISDFLDILVHERFLWGVSNGT